MLNDGEAVGDMVGDVVGALVQPEHVSRHFCWVAVSFMQAPLASKWLHSVAEYVSTMERSAEIRSHLTNQDLHPEHVIGQMS